MQFKNTYSSVVVAGNGFSHLIFKASDHKDLLGDIDNNHQQVILPNLLSQQTFSGGFKITISPERLDMAYLNEDFLPDNLKILSSQILKNLENLPDCNCVGIGINLNVVISENVLGTTGEDFCKKNFLLLTNIEQKLNCSEFLSNTAKLIFLRDSIKYIVDVGPVFKSDRKDLQININAHQECSGLENLLYAFHNYDSVRQYFEKFHENLLGNI